MSIRRLVLFAAAMMLLSCVPARAPFTVLLSWAANAETNLAGYKVYCGTNSQLWTRVEDVGNVTCTQVTNLTDCTPHYFVVTAYDTFGLESLPSEEIGVTPGCVTVSVTVSSNITTAGILIWETNVPPKNVPMFFTARIATLVCTNLPPRGVIYGCTNGIMTTNYTGSNGSGLLLIMPPPPPKPPAKTLAPIINPFH